MDRRPDPSEYAPYYGRYVALVPDGPVLDVLRAQPDALARQLRTADPDMAYAPGKWTVHQALQHVADAERVFAYRALRFARGDESPLASFDEDTWAANADVSGRPFGDTLAEFRAVRAATVALFEGLPSGVWDRAGTASGNRMSVRAAAYLIAGHAAHHAAVYRDRYGLS
jgi:hypothetical protein